MISYRLPVRGSISPAVFTIDYKAAMEGLDDKAAAALKRRGLITEDLRIFVSFDIKEPSEGRCDETFFSETNFAVHTRNKQAKIFDNSNIYVSFLSAKGCSINVTANMAKPRVPIKKGDYSSDEDNFMGSDTEFEPFK